MNRDQAYRLISDTFTRAYNKDGFLLFVRNLLNRFDETKASTMQVPNAFAQHVHSCRRFGTYTSPKGELLEVLAVTTTEEFKVERTRTGLRNFVAHKLKREGNYKDAALVAFVSPSERQWRFSYIKMEYAAVEKESGDVGVETRLTPARRFSYIVGEGESCHTAQSRFVGLLQDTHTDPTLAVIEEAFSVEAVTKEFFLRYKQLFDKIHIALDDLTVNDKKIREEFQRKQISTADFAKKLMGQIVFLYFLQKKGWLGVEKEQEWGTGPRDFMRRMAKSEYRKYANFFNDILEPLFYDTLATDRGHESLCKIFKCRIPFLNGGLFEPLGDYNWRKTDILLPDSLFTNEERFDEGIAGTGVLDIFDRYNFTVNEAEPLEQEVAIDPEMLGKVFENLSKENRKGLGTFYTPREIVHYMCQESLIDYLNTAIPLQAVSILPKKAKQVSLFGDTAPEQEMLKIADSEKLVPRSEIETFIRYGEQISHYESVDTSYRIKMPRSIVKHASQIDEILEKITVCDPACGSGAFLVGMMTEIVRARSSLTKHFNDYRERSPYIFKRKAIQDCLYGVDIDPGAVEIARLRLWLSLVVDEERTERIEPLPNLDYKIVRGNSLVGVEKDKRQVLWQENVIQEIEDLKKKEFDEANSERKMIYKREIVDFIRSIMAGDDIFEFNIYFSEVFRRKNAGFDIVIANPPYVRQENIKEYKAAFEREYQCYTGTADLYVFFYERAFQLLREGGTLAFISSNKYMRAAYGEKLRTFLAGKSTIQYLIDFGDAPVFEAIAYPSIIILRKRKADGPTARHLSSEPHQVRVFTWKPGPPIEDFSRVFRDNSFLIRQKELTPDGWRLESPAVLRLLDKLRNAGTPLGEYVNGRFYRGILTGLNEAFVVDRVTRDWLIAEHPSSEEILKPFLRGRDVKRWRVEFADQYLIKIESSENVQHPWSGKRDKEAESVFAKTYPAIHAWFEPFRSNLKKRQDQGHYFWELRSCIYWREFEQPKIVYPNICKRNEFAWDEDIYYTNQKTFIIPVLDKCLLAVLNSSTVMWMFPRVLAKLQNDFYEPSSIFMTKIPIPHGAPKQKSQIVTLVDRILAAKEHDPDADVSELEGEIDRRVYELYGLTKEEIKIVEGKSEP